MSFPREFDCQPYIFYVYHCKHSKQKVTLENQCYIVFTFTLSKIMNSWSLLCNISSPAEMSDIQTQQTPLSCRSSGSSFLHSVKVFCGSEWNGETSDFDWWDLHSTTDSFSVGMKSSHIHHVCHHQDLVVLCFCYICCFIFIFFKWTCALAICQHFYFQ